MLIDYQYKGLKKFGEKRKEITFKPTKVGRELNFLEAGWRTGQTVGQPVDGGKLK